MLLLLTASLALAAPPDRGVGGEPAPEGAWPDAAAVLRGGALVCSGVLIAPRFVLTAGHCDQGADEVVLDSVDYTSPVESIPVIGAQRHPDPWNTYDVAVLELARDAATPPRLLARDCVVDRWLAPGAPVAIVGYGATDPWSWSFGEELVQAFTTVSEPACADEERGCNPDVMPDGELIAGGGGVDSCNGDSGGPLYLLTDAGDWLVGITSRGATPALVPCGDGGIYVRVDAVADWIEATVGAPLPRLDDCPTPPNRAPAPTAEPITLVQGGSAATQVMVNDPDPGDRHVFRVIVQPRGGTAEVDADGRVTYAADPDFDGPDTLTVEVRDDGAPPLAGAAQVDVWVSRRDDTGDERPRGVCGCSAEPERASGTAMLLALAALLGSRRGARPLPS